MNNIKLDKLLNELKQRNTSVDFNEFCNRNWGKSSNTFKECRIIAKTLVDDGFAEYTPNNSQLILLTPKGSKFKGYVQAEMYNHLAENEKKEIYHLKKTNLFLSNEKMEYEKTIRQLQKKLLFSSLLKNYGWLLVSAFSIGLVIGKIL